MWKQFLSKLPRKSLKSESGTDYVAAANGGTMNGGGPATTTGGSDGLCSDLPAGDPACRSAVAATATANGGPGKRMSAAVFPSNEAVEPSLSFKDVPGHEKHNLFISKLRLCCTVYDFNDTSAKDLTEKDAKRRALFELVEYVASGSVKFGEPAISQCCAMFEANLFRPLPSHCRGGASTAGGENDVDEPLFDPAWSHLQVVYELLLKFIACKDLDAKLAKKYVDHSFILKLLDLFDSEDPRERDCLKTILHRIYGKFMVHRPFIRKSVSNIFYRFVFETERHNGIAELLEVFGSVISGFALPLKEEHKMFLWKALIPLHKPKMVGIYLQQLTYCVIQFIDKEPKLVSTVIRGLLKYWPVTNSQKEVMFLGELEEVLESTNLVEFQKVMVPMFRRIGYCLNSSHFQVAERALFLWNNDHVISLIAQNRHVILPIIFPSLERNTRNHWNQAVLNVTMNVRKIFFDMDEELFSSCQKKFQDEEAERTAMEEKRRVAWEKLEYAAAYQPANLRTPAIVTPMAPPLLIANHG